VSVLTEPAAVLAVVASAVVAAGTAGAVVRPTPRLGPRLRPYTAAARSALGRGADPAAIAEPGPVLSGNVLRRLLEPVVGRAARRLGSVLDRDGDERLGLRLAQAGLLIDVPASRRVQEYRVRQLTRGLAQAAAFGTVALAAGRGAGPVLGALVLGGVAGVARLRGRVDRAIDGRRAAMRMELYTVNQLLALHVRVGGGVAAAVQHVVERGSGAVVGELAEVLRSHRSGRRLGEALLGAATTTPEPHAARTYRLLAHGTELGSDLAEGLRLLSEDLRVQRVESLKRAATRRRAAMLVPIIAVLAPVMLLFVAAPLPSIVFGAAP